MRRKIIFVVLVISLFLVSATVASATEVPEDKVLVLSQEQGVSLNEMEVPGYEYPFVINECGEYLVPLRIVAETAGWSVYWGSLHGSVWLERQDPMNFMGMIIDRSFFGEMTPVIFGSRTMVPIGFLTDRMSNVEIVTIDEKNIVLNITKE